MPYSIIPSQSGTNIASNNAKTA